LRRFITLFMNYFRGAARPLSHYCPMLDRR
jgi:hypothetical protein